MPENCSIADQLPQIENDQLNENSSEDENDNDNMVTHTFIPSPPPSHSEELAIKNPLIMYASNQHDTLSNDGFAAYKQFQEVYKLDVIQQQSGDSEEQQKFREILCTMENQLWKTG